MDRTLGYGLIGVGGVFAVASIITAALGNCYTLAPNYWATRSTGVTRIAIAPAWHGASLVTQWRF